jgi:hypothetical protein
MEILTQHKQVIILSFSLEDENRSSYFFLLPLSKYVLVARDEVELWSELSQELLRQQKMGSAC